MAYQATKKTAANKAYKYQKIIDITQQQIAKAGFASVFMADIAQQAGIATGTLYRYFANKQQLCGEVFRIYTEIEVNLVQQLANQPDKNPTDKLINAITSFARRAIKSRHLAWSLIAEPLDPALESQRLKYRQAYCDIYSVLIDEGIKQQHFRQQNAAISAAAIVGALAESLVGPLAKTTPSPIDDKQLINNIVAFCLFALGANKHDS
ncbi:MAG: TetR family transcriptional regulator [Gammaproteobacteria bacterium]|nr:MAG: TetR family transcriptional regulator [Gammaproteobacteria bacterium]